MGRTGARGRGALWRFGPNHMIVIIVSRWRKQSNNLNEFMNVDGRRMIEFLACKDIVYGEWKLPDVGFLFFIITTIYFRLFSILRLK